MKNENPAALPMSRAEMEQLGWSTCDVILVSGDAYVDHPAFGTAMIGRVLQSEGFRVGIIAQPDIRNIESFRHLGKPTLFWGITAGNVDSQLAKLTVMRKLRRDDSYTPGGKAGQRPSNASIVYSCMVKQAFKGVPVILGGIEASLRRFAYYDYWTNKVKRSIIFDAKADLVAYGMAELSIKEIAHRLKEGKNLIGIPGTAEISKDIHLHENTIEISSYENISTPDETGRASFAGMTRTIIEQHRQGSTTRLVQKHGDRWLIVNPPSRPLSPTELDNLYALPFTRHPHPSYGNVHIPAYDMITNSITTHRGCYAGCSFCAINVHQGRTVISRSENSILKEAARIAADKSFRGTITDFGGPTANMYGTGCKQDPVTCRKESCLFPNICKNLKIDHSVLLKLMKNLRHAPGVKHAFVSSGIRFDLALAGGGERYIEELVSNHVSGLLKIAPEHISERVMLAMRKPSMSKYREFVNLFLKHVRQNNRRYSIVEYFMSGHPGCTLDDMVELACYLKQSGIRPEQVQDFYPAPLTIANCMFYTGMDPLTGRKIHVARTDREKALQRALLLSHLPEFRTKATIAFKEASRANLAGNRSAYKSTEDTHRQFVGQRHRNR